MPCHDSSPHPPRPHLRIGIAGLVLKEFVPSLPVAKSAGQKRRSGIASPTGTLHPRKGNEAESPLPAGQPSPKKTSPEFQKTTKLRYNPP